MDPVTLSLEQSWSLQVKNQNAEGVDDQEKDSEEESQSTLGSDIVTISDEAKQLLAAKLAEYDADNPDDLTEEEQTELRAVLAEAFSAEEDSTETADEVEGEEEDTVTTTAATGESDDSQAAGAASGSEESSSDDTAIEELEEQIEELEQEIQDLEAKAQTDETSKKELNEKRMELSMLESELALLDQQQQA